MQAQSQRHGDKSPGRDALRAALANAGAHRPEPRQRHRDTGAAKHAAAAHFSLKIEVDVDGFTVSHLDRMLTLAYLLRNVSTDDNVQQRRYEIHSRLSPTASAIRFDLRTVRERNGGTRCRSSSTSRPGSQPNGAACLEHQRAKFRRSRLNSCPLRHRVTGVDLRTGLASAADEQAIAVSLHCPAGSKFSSAKARRIDLYMAHGA